ncbi:kininogen-1-like [Callorhinchus milii]|uniref:kininogen-1-like n=1 Tax=Callorhinchus milii TaxID=7868 RepID=UPI001C3F7FD4|nr:kininogen-1-like [Callorhinchus milii]
MCNMAYGAFVFALCFATMHSATVSDKSKGFIRVPLSDPEANLAADYAATAYNRKSDSPYLFRLRQLKSAKYKMVSLGVKMYLVTFDIMETLCQEHMTLRICPFRTDRDTVMGTCQGVVYFELGFQVKTYKTTCDLLKPVKEMVEKHVAVVCEGCLMSARPDDPSVKETVELALKKYNHENKGRRKFALSKITFATRELSEGERYWVNFKIHEMECPDDANQVASNCSLKPLGAAVIGDCHAESVFPVAGMSGHIQGFPKCHLILPILDEDIVAVNASCTGCSLPLNTKDPRVQSSIDFAISRFNNKSNEAFKYALTRVISAEHEVSAGEEITVHFDLIETDCPKVNESTEETCEPKTPTEAGMANCSAVQKYDIFGKLLYHRLMCGLVCSGTVRELDIVEVYMNGTEEETMQPLELTEPTSNDMTKLTAEPTSELAPEPEEEPDRNTRR